MAVYKGKGFVQLTGRNNMSSILGSGSSHNTISISGAQGTSASSASSWLNQNMSNWANDLSLNLNSHHHSIKKFEMYETPVDVLTLSCTLQRLREEREYGHKILDKKVVESVTSEDHAKSATIRDYYSKKIMFGKLNEKLFMSKFREDMNKFVHSDGLHFKESDIGMICYLPTFYDYDIQVDEVKASVVTNQGFRDMDSKGTPNALDSIVTLKPLKKIVRKTRNRELLQYWFTDDKLNAGVLMHLTKDNPLLHIWDNLFLGQESLKVSGYFARTHSDDFEYFKVSSWKLVTD